MKPIAIIQARQNSERLPNKVLMPINNASLIENIYKRVVSKKYKTLVAISQDKSDDILSSHLKLLNIPYYRGSLNNVKSRFLKICENYSDEKLVIRLTADNIFPDKFLINEMIKFFNKNKKDYLFINQKNKKIPYGLSVELFRISELRKIKNKNPKDIEHVTYSFNKKNNEFPIDSKYFFTKKASIDTTHDYFYIENFFRFQKIDTLLNWKKLIKKFYEFSTKNKNIKSLYDIRVSKIIIGAAQFGNLYGISNSQKIDPTDIKKIAFFSNLAGINKIDTARDYLNSEKNIGKYFKNNMEIYTKISNKINYTYNENKINNVIRNSVKTSKKFLNLNKLMCLYIHNLPNKKKINYKILEYLKKNKKNLGIQKIGLSITKLDEVEKVHNTKIKDYIDVVQIPKNILDNRLSKRKISLLKKNNIVVIYRSIFLQGLFFMKKKSEWPKKLRKFYNIFFNKMDHIQKKLKCSSILELALRYIVSFDNDSKIIIGMNSFSHLTEIYSFLFKKNFNIRELRFIEKQLRMLNKKEIFLNPTLWK